MLQARFLTLLPRIEAHARIYFCSIRCADKLADRIAETIALAWKWFLRLEERGKDATQFVSAIATFAAKAVKSGRRLAGMERAKDVMNGRTQYRHDCMCFGANGSTASAPRNHCIVSRRLIL
jgi:hypothetical protein